MDREIKIRSNINSSFIEIERLRIEREEREKAEREARWQKEREERERLENEWKETHKNLFKYTYCSYYCKDTFNYQYGGYCKIHFYEWSDVNKEPIVFNHYPELYRFLDECDLWIDEEQNNMIKPIASCYISCKPGSKELIVATTYDGLCQKMSEAKTLADVLSTVPEV